MDYIFHKLPWFIQEMESRGLIWTRFLILMVKTNFIAFRMASGLNILLLFASVYCNVKYRVPCFILFADVSQAGSISTGVTPRFSNIAYCNATEFQLISDEPQNEARDSAHLEKASVQCRDESAGNDDDTGISHNCGLLSNTLLPCLACAESLDQKRKLQSPRSPSLRKKLSLTTSFKRRDGQPNTILRKCFCSLPLTKRYGD